MYNVGDIFAIDQNIEIKCQPFQARYFVVTSVGQFTCHGRVSQDAKEWYSWISLPHTMLGEKVGVHRDYDGTQKEAKKRLDNWKYYEREIGELLTNVKIDLPEANDSLEIVKHLDQINTYINSKIQAELKTIGDLEFKAVLFANQKETD